MKKRWKLLVEQAFRWIWLTPRKEKEMTDEEKKVEQVAIAGWLVPEEVPEVEAEDIPLDRLVDWETGPEPTPEFVESISNFGVIEPVVVRHAKRGQKKVYEVIDGRRRVRAAIMCEYETIPARVYPLGFGYAGVLTLSLNSLRSSNPIAELEAIGRLLVKGAGESEIARATGLSVQTIRKRLKLQNLKPEIRDAVRVGKVAVSVAEQTAKLSDNEQESLAVSLKDSGKFTMREVKAIKSAKAADAASSIPMDVFKPKASHWSTIVADRLEQTLKMVPDDEIALHDALRKIIVDLDTRDEHEEVS